MTKINHSKESANSHPVNKEMDMNLSIKKVKNNSQIHTAVFNTYYKFLNYIFILLGMRITRFAEFNRVPYICK